MELLNTESGEIDWISGHVNGTCKWIWELTRREIGWCEIASNNNDVLGSNRGRVDKCERE